jgi:catechol 2,3-dioxygenase-like lactoylglutathione lyase family enzyme
MANACSHIGLCVTDLERSRRFYEGVFGFRLAFDLRTEGPETPQLLRLDAPLVLDAVYLALDGLLLELLYFERPTSPPAQERDMNAPGLTHLSLFVEDVDAVLAAVPQYGGRVRDDTNIGVAVFVEDPDGQAIEVIGPGGQFRNLRDEALRKRQSHNPLE